MSRPRSLARLLPSLLVLWTASCRPTCPVQRSTPPAPVVVASRPVPPCSLPQLPLPITLGAIVLSDGGFAIGPAKFEALALYLARMRSWVAAADECIRARE